MQRPGGVFAELLINMKNSSLFSSHMKFLGAGLLFISITACQGPAGDRAVPMSGPATNSSPDVGLVSGTALSGTALSGTINGGGGVGLRCGGKLEVLDLYEARAKGFTFSAADFILEAPTNQKIADFVGERVAKHYWNPESVTVEQTKQIFSKEILLPILEGREFMNFATGKPEQVRFVETLPLSNDWGRYQIPKGCSFEQIAYFSDVSTELSIVTSKWNELDSLSKAVLVAHELIYLVERRDGIEKLLGGSSSPTSESTRSFVGRLLSDRSVISKSAGLPLVSQLLRCSSDDSFANAKEDPLATYFYAFKNKKSGETNLVFKQILGGADIYQLRAELEKNKSLSRVRSIDSPRKSSFFVRHETQNGKLKSVEFFGADRKTALGTKQNVTCEKF